MDEVKDMLEEIVMKSWMSMIEFDEEFKGLSQKSLGIVTGLYFKGLQIDDSSLIKVGTMDQIIRALLRKYREWKERGYDVSVLDRHVNQPK